MTILKCDVRGDFELNPKETPLRRQLLGVMGRLEHEKECAYLQRQMSRLGIRLKDGLS